MDTDHVNSWYDNTVDLFTEGQDYVYDVNPYRRTIDLSANHLTGEVPLELFRLVQVQTLNLSHNSFIGFILHFLGYLNLSYNSFEGKISIRTQLQSFNASSYIGNRKLCRDPLNNCTTKEENPKTAKPSTENEDYDSKRINVSWHGSWICSRFLGDLWFFVSY